MTLTPAEFLAQPSDPEEDLEPEQPTSSLESIAESLRTLAGYFARQEVDEDRNCAHAHAYADIEQENARLESLHDQKQALIDEVLALCKPSTSKLANAIRAVLEPVVVPEKAKFAGFITDEQPEQPAEGVAPVDFKIDASEVATAAISSAVDRGQAFELGPNASVEDWRAYARMFGHTGPDVDQANASQIRTLLGLPHPTAQPS